MAVGKRETEREWGGVLWCIDCGTTVRDASGCQETKVEEVEAKKEPETESKTEKPKLSLTWDNVQEALVHIHHPTLLWICEQNLNEFKRKGAFNSNIQL